MHAREWEQRELMKAFTILGKMMWGGYMVDWTLPKIGRVFVMREGSLMGVYKAECR